MRKLLLLLALSQLAWAQPDDLPPPPPLLPEKKEGQAAPFNPDQTSEAIPQPALQLKAPADWTSLGTMTLQQAVGLALTRQPDVVSARAQVLQANGGTTQLRAELMPRLSGTTTFSHRSTTEASALGGSLTSISQTHQSTLGLNQLLFDFGNTRERVHQADLLRQSADSGVQAAENDLALTVKEQYYTVVETRELLEVAEKDLANRQEQLRLARALYKAGNKSPGDVVRAQTTVSTSVFNLNKARRDLEIAQQQLLQALGFPPLTPLQLTDLAEPEVSEREVSTLLERAAQVRPDLVAAQKTVEARQAGLNAAHTTNYPSVAGYAGLTYQGLANGIQYPAVVAQLQVSYNLFDGGARAGVIEQAQGALQAAQADLLRVQLSVQSEVTTVLAQVVSAERNVEAARLASEASQQGVRIAFGRYKAALGTLTDVFDAQNQFLSAGNNLASAQADLSRSRARLRHALAAPFAEGY